MSIAGLGSSLNRTYLDPRPSAMRSVSREIPTTLLVCSGTQVVANYAPPYFRRGITVFPTEGSCGQSQHQYHRHGGAEAMETMNAAE
jgi:hypothetical protein